MRRLLKKWQEGGSVDIIGLLTYGCVLLLVGRGRGGGGGVCDAGAGFLEVRHTGWNIHVRGYVAGGTQTPDEKV